MFKPMLAVNTKVNKVKLPAIGSLKLEGVRAELTPDGLKTRPMKRFGNDWIEVKFAKLLEYCKDNDVYLEGEFYIHGMKFNEISSICRRKHHEDTDKIELHLFDGYFPTIPSAGFADRSRIIHDILSEDDYDNVVAIEQVVHNCHKSIESSYSYAIENGYEGYVLKSPTGSYKTGRSTHKEQKFLRIKQENTYDGVVIDIIERFENLVPSELNELGYMSKTQDKDMKGPTGMAAVAVTMCSDFEGEIRVTLSRGLTDQDRAEIWDNRQDLIGKHIRFVGIPVEGMLPRAPRFDAWRTDLD